MNYFRVQTIAVRLGAVALLVMGYHWYGWPGVAGAADEGGRLAGMGGGLREGSGEGGPGTAIVRQSGRVRSVRGGFVRCPVLVKICAKCVFRLTPAEAAVYRPHPSLESV